MDKAPEKRKIWPCEYKLHPIAGTLEWVPLMGTGPFVTEDRYTTLKTVAEKLAGALEAFHNDKTYGLGFTGMAENHLRAQLEALQAWKELGDV